MKSSWLFIFTLFFTSCSTVKKLPLINTFSNEEKEEKEGQEKINISVTCFEEMDEQTFKVIIGHKNSFGQNYHVLSGENNYFYSLDKNQNKIIDQIYKEYIVEEFIPGIELETVTIDSLNKSLQYFWKLEDQTLAINFNSENKCSQNKDIYQKSFDISYTIMEKRNVKIIWRDLEKDEVIDYKVETSIDGINYAQIYHDENLTSFRSIASKKDPYTFDHIIKFPYEGNWFIRLKRVEKNNSYEYKELKINLK